MADTHLPPPQPIDPGVPGSIVDGRDRRVGRDARRRRDKLRAVYARRLVRERRLGRRLDRELGPVAIVLHTRQADGDGAAIDHLIVAASGVWVIDARHERGKVERPRGAERRAEAWIRPRQGQPVRIVEPHRSVEIVEGHLERMGFGWLDVHRAVCLTNADWGVRRPFEIDGILVTWGRSLVETIGVRGALGPVDMRAVAVELSSRLPAMA